MTKDLNKDLRHFAQEGMIDKMKELIEQGADVNAGDPQNFRALTRSLEVLPHNKDKDVMATFNFLIENGADIDFIADGNETLLMTAALEGQPEAAKYLIDKGLDVNVRFDTQGTNSILDELAIKEGQAPRGMQITKTVDGKKVLVTDPEEIKEALGGEPGEELESYVQIAKLVLGNGFEVNSTNEFGQNPLFAAATNGALQIALLLLEKGGDPNKQDKWGLAPLHYAARKGFAEIVENLLAHGADPNLLDDYGFTAMHEAAMSGKLDCLKALVKAGGDVSLGLKKGFDANYVEGFTPLDCAKLKKHKSTVEFLMNLS